MKTTSSECVEAKDWRDVVERRDSWKDHLIVRVCAVEQLVDREDARVGDQLVLRDVDVKQVRLSLATSDDYNNHNDENKSACESVEIPINFRDKFRVCPHFDWEHVFQNVQEILNVYPAVYDVLFSKESFTVNSVDIQALDLMQIMGVVQDVTGSSESLQVRVLKTNQLILLPSTMRTEFVQWKQNWTLQDKITPKEETFLTYSISELNHYWKPELRPLKIKVCGENKDSLTASGTENMKRKRFDALRGLFKSREKQLDEKKTEKEFKTDDDWMLPKEWRCRELVFEPIHIVIVSNTSDPNRNEYYLPGDLKIKVMEVKTPEDGPLFSSNAGSLMDLSPRSSRSSSDPSALPLSQLDILSLLGAKSRGHAIVGVIGSGAGTCSRQQGSLSHGTWVALHRTRRVRKLIMTSQDSKRFLVSAHYNGNFERLPLIFDCAGDVPTGDGMTYITRCTSYPVEKILDPCYEGQFVQFSKSSVIKIKDKDVKVVHCTVSSQASGPQHSVTYPVNLPGRFERVEQQSCSGIMTSQDLFKKIFPICVKVVGSDLSLGFDPLAQKETVVVKGKINELTVIVESLRKTDEGLKSTGVLHELPASRSAILLREVQSTQDGDDQGIDPFPRRSDFKGLQKLPCVELLSERDVTELQDLSKCCSTISLTSPSPFEPPKETVSIPEVPERQPVRYAKVVKAQTNQNRFTFEKCEAGELSDGGSIDLERSSADDLDLSSRTPGSASMEIPLRDEHTELYASAEDISRKKSDVLSVGEKSPFSAPPIPAPRKGRKGNAELATSLPNMDCDKPDRDFPVQAQRFSTESMYDVPRSFSVGQYPVESEIREYDRPTVLSPVDNDTNSSLSTKSGFVAEPLYDTPRPTTGPFTSGEYAMRQWEMSTASYKTEHVEYDFPTTPVNVANGVQGAIIDEAYDDMRGTHNSRLSPTTMPGRPPKPKQYCG
ncbi:uncharacterized protein LOC143465601 [Clavelina lepadiformis]|uniref:uncharacterized protein LOC143465601 n=1 Tax=Clavelina lepadiformis TaxID=159417 RepID=UPI004041D256